MSGFDRDYEVKRELTSNVGNFDDFERLDNYALHEQPEAEERESTELTSPSSFDLHHHHHSPPSPTHHDNGHHPQQHGDDLLLNLSKVDDDDGFGGSSLLHGSSFSSSSSVLHSTARPLVTTEIGGGGDGYGPPTSPPPPPPVQVCSKPVPESMEIHLTPDPDELRAAEPFVNITAADHYEEEDEEQEFRSQQEEQQQHRSHYDDDDDTYVVNQTSRSKYLIDDDNDDLDPVYEHPRQTDPHQQQQPHRYSSYTEGGGDDDDEKEDDDIIGNKITSRANENVDDLLNQFSPSAPPPQRHEEATESSAFSHQHYYKEEIEEIAMSSDDSIPQDNTTEETVNVTFQTHQNDEPHQQHTKNLLEEADEEQEQKQQQVQQSEPEPPKLCVCPSKMSEGRKQGQCCMSAWFKAENLDPRVAELIYWRDVKKTGAVFGAGLTVLLSLTYFSLISVLAYSLLAVVVGTISYRIYKNVLQAVQKSGEGHPFKVYLEMELNLPQDKLHEVAEIVVDHLESIAKKLRRLFLVEDIVDSLKFALMLWCFTYVGAWFNGLTLFILAFVALFTLPKVYETYKTEIDHYVEIAATQVNGVLSKVKAKIPIGKKPKEQ